jgi:hypothetical protein
MRSPAGTVLIIATVVIFLIILGTFAHFVG